MEMLLKKPEQREKEKKLVWCVENSAGEKENSPSSVEASKLQE